MLDRVQGFCPMGCGETLQLYDGIIRCTNMDCSNSAAVTTILLDRQTEHVVYVDKHGNWSAKHPLRERLGDLLLDCDIEVGVEEMFDAGADVPGKYVFTYDGSGDWSWRPLDSGRVT